MTTRAYLGIDVGTGSVRAALFDAQGNRLGMGVHAIRIWHPAEDFVEQSSDDIWQAAGAAVRAALVEAGLPAECVAGIGFDATCSLVALDERDEPVSVSPSGSSEQNVIVWMDHRATAEAEQINRTGHAVLEYVGGRISPEMQVPKLSWLKQHLPETWQRARRFLDLADFMSYRATGNDARSLCTTVCKWTYLGHEARFRDDFFRQVGLDDLIANGYEKIGPSVRPMGERAGGLLAKAASELGLAPGTPVGIGIIDAHAGGIGMLGAQIDGRAPTLETLECRLALIGGTSSCHMAVSRKEKFVPGIWGPYHSAMVPGLWLTEGGQSATGALIDHVVTSHTRGSALKEEALRAGTTPYALLNQRLDALSSEVGFEAELVRDLHVLPYFHGNRSPRADPSLRGVVSGLKLSDSVDQLALLYLSTIHAIAHGTRHIIGAMNAQGYRIDTLLACGGDTKNPKFVQAHADITGCRVILPREPEAVLLGAAILGAIASGDFTGSGPGGAQLGAMAAMNAAGAEVLPRAGAVRAFHEKKHAVFQRMYGQFMELRELMS